MPTPDLGALLAMLGSGGGADAEPIPSLPMGGAVPQPMAPAGQMGPMLPDPRPQPNLAQHHSAADFVRQLAPMFLSVLAARKNPMYGAAVLNGHVRGAQMARQERMDAEKKAEDTNRIKQAYISHVLSDVRTFKDPHQAAQYLSLADDIGAQQFGLPKGWTAKMPVPRTSETDALKAEIAQKLAAFDKNARWKTVAGTPAEAKISIPLGNGQTMSVAAARRLVGQQFLNDKGDAAYAPAADTDAPENKTDYSRFLTRWAKEHGKASANDLTAAEEIQAKKAYGQADDRPFKGTDPILEQIRALTLANLQKTSGGELAPGQATAGGKLADDYRAESKDFIQVSQAFNRVRASAKDPSAAGDLALIFNYMKTLDPGSTVREGEFATAQNAGGVPDRIVALYNKVKSGERLSPGMRSDFVDRSKRLYTQALGQQRRIVDQYRKRAKAVNVPADFVITDYSVSEEEEATPPAKALKIGRFGVVVSK